MDIAASNGNVGRALNGLSRAISPLGRAGNMMLNSLPDSAFEALEPLLREERFAKGTVLWDSEQSSRIYFPLSGLIAIVSGPLEGDGIQVGCVGCESAAGLSRDSQGFTSGVVQVEGIFLCVPAARFWDMAAENAELLKMATLCTEWLLIQAQCTASCNAVHDAQKRLCRWLLQVADRGGKEFSSTQEEMAQLLGLRRTTLTLVAHKLQSDGLIRYRRGRIELCDRARLEELACDCYRCQPNMTWTTARMSRQRFLGEPGRAIGMSDAI